MWRCRGCRAMIAASSAATTRPRSVSTTYTCCGRVSTCPAARSASRSSTRWMSCSVLSPNSSRSQSEDPAELTTARPAPAHRRVVAAAASAAAAHCVDSCLLTITNDRPHSCSVVTCGDILTDSGVWWQGEGEVAA